MRARLVLALIASVVLAGPGHAADAIKVTSSAFAAGGAIPKTYSAYGANHSPPLAWTAAPGAKAYALVLRDTDAPGGNFIHWLVWNIPGSATAMPENGLSGVSLGKNDAGRAGYFGPMPPGGRHHYHFVVYALDATLDLPAGANLGKLQAAMKGHVLGQGELVGTYAP